MSRRARRRIVHAVAVMCFVVPWLTPAPAPATIAEQRARLPPAAECSDELVAGIWRSHKFNHQFGDWSIWTLVIRRVPGSPDQLIGSITNRNWEGGPEDEEPVPCERQWGDDWTVSTDARGTVTNGTELRFSGVGQWRLDAVHCRRGPGTYNLDNFTGTIDRERLEFQSVNNDGGRAVNIPNVFRRIRCPPMNSAEAPTVRTTPPAYYPDRPGGCGR